LTWQPAGSARDAASEGPDSGSGPSASRTNGGESAARCGLGPDCHPGRETNTSARRADLGLHGAASDGSQSSHTGLQQSVAGLTRIFAHALGLLL
jgi:hypothetical protein